MTVGSDRFEDERALFDSNGFVVVRAFLSPPELAELSSQIQRYICDVVPAAPDSHAFYEDRQRPETLKQLQHMAIDPFFDGYRSHERWTRLAESLLGEPCRAQDPEWFNKPPGVQHATPPHQDNFYFCLRPCQVATLWLALDPIDESNGCLRYVAGSHREGIREHMATSVLGFSQGIFDYGEADAAREVAAVLEPGDLVAHHGATIHRAASNGASERQRRAFAMVFRGQSVRRDEQAFARYEAALRRQHDAMGL